MVDIGTYRQMHPDAISVHEESDVIRVDGITPPEGSFLFILPPTIRGYGFHDKKWSKSRNHS
jgi:hypothetical protein